MRKPAYPGELIEKMNRHKTAHKAAHYKGRHKEMHYKHLKHHKISPLTGMKEGSPMDMVMDKKIAKQMPFHKSLHVHHHKILQHLHKLAGQMHPDHHKKMVHHLHKMMHHLHKHATSGHDHHLHKAHEHVAHAHKMMMHHKLAHLKPHGARGRAQVKKLGRTFKTGGFSKIAAKAAQKYGSAERGKKVAGAIFQKMARKHAAKAHHKKA